MAVSVGLMVLSIGLSLLAGKLLAARNKAIAQDDAPTTLATRGAYLPRIIGRRQVGAVFAWAGERFTTKESGGKKGGLPGTGSEIEIFRESGWHLLCVGPGKALHTIRQSGTAIFVGPITPSSHPSGSLIDLGNEGSFKIYWGENDQPVNTSLGSVGFDGLPRVGVSSRWPRKMYIEWIAKRLSSSPIWPRITYDIEVAPQETHLTDTAAYFEPTETLDGSIETVSAVTNGIEGVGAFSVLGDVVAEFSNTGKFRLAGNSGLADQDFNVFKVEARIVNNVFPVPDVVWTDVYPQGTLSGATADGTIQGYSEAQDDGYNPAHILADLWFSEWPYGIARDKTRFDMQSLEDFGTLAVTEDLRCSVIAKDGMSLRSLFANIHQDMGLMLPIDFTTGQLKFQPVREPTSTIPNLTDDVLLELPSIDTRHGPRKADRLIFSFTDRENFFREMTIGLDDAGQASLQEHFRARTVPIVSTINFDVANTIGERRSQEELAGGGPIKLIGNRGARVLIPGTQVTASGISEILLITDVEVDPLSGRVTVNCIQDFMAANKSSFVQNQGQITSPALPVKPDEQFQPVELPEWLSGPQQQVMSVRIRAHAQVTSGAIHISRDDTTFTSKGKDTSIMQGGTLTSALAIDADWELAEGPTFDALGPDIGSVLDLSSDSISWRNGRQLVVIGSEIFFLQGVTAMGGDSYRLDGLIRARYDTRPEAHAIGSEVYIVQNDDGLPIEDVLIEPEVTLYVKSQAIGNGVANLAAVVSESLDLYGKGIRPVPVAEIRFDLAGDPAGVTTLAWTGADGGDLPVTWGYFTPQSSGTGAGFAGAGTPQSAASPEGDFLVEVLSSGDVLQRSTTVTTNAYSYTETDRLADFGSEPASFKIRVTQLRAGLSSDATTQEFTKV